MRSPAVILDDNQIRSFRENGFLALPAISTPEEVARLRGIFDRLLDSKAGFNEGAQFDLISGGDCAGPASLPEIMNPVNYAPQLRDTLFRVNALAIAKQLLGAEAAPFFEHAILKPPHEGPATPWHQDEAYRLEPNFDCRQLSIWMPLLDVTSGSGCMQFIPGSNLGEVLTHRPANNDPKNHAYECCGNFNPADAVACSLPAGGCTIHDGRTLHYTGPNASGVPRWAYILVFDLPPRARTEKYSFPWSKKTLSADVARRRAWLRNGGRFIELWRILRRGVPKNAQRRIYLMHRLLRALRTNTARDDH